MRCWRRIWIGGGAGNSARALDLAGHNVLLAWKNEWSLAMTASCGFSRMSCGFVGASDGWQDLKQNFKMDWEFGSATDGNVAMMGEIDLECIAQRDIESSIDSAANAAVETRAQRPKAAKRCANSRWRSELAMGITPRSRR